MKIFMLLKGLFSEYSPRKIPPIHGRIPPVHGCVPVVRGRIPLADANGIHRLCSITAPSQHARPACSACRRRQPPHYARSDPESHPHVRRRQGGCANPPYDTACRTSWMPCHTAARSAQTKTAAPAASDHLTETHPESADRSSTTS